MPAVPALIMGGSALVSSLVGAKAQSDTAKTLSQRSPEELALMKSQTGLADQQRQQGSQLFNTAMPAVNNTLNYYRTLLSGNRSARMAATSPESQDTAAAYSGADAGLARSGLRGGELAQAKAGNATAKAGSLARLVTGVRPGAAAAMGSAAGGLINTAGGMESGASSTYGGLIGADQQNRQQAQQIGLGQGNRASGNMGSLIARLMGTYGSKLGTGKWGFGGDGGGGGSTGASYTGLE